MTLDQATSGAADDTSTTTVHEYYPSDEAGGNWRVGQIKKTIITSNAPGTASVQKSSEFTYYESGNSKGLLDVETIDPDTAFAVHKKHIYDESGNEVKTLTSATGLPTLVSETWYDSSGRFPVASVNAMGHATVSTYDNNRSLATSATLAFKVDLPGSDATHGSTVPTAPDGTPHVGTIYDEWGTSKMTTAADGLKNVRFTSYFVDGSLPRCLYYVYEQTEGSSPVITYYDRYHRPLLVEKTGFNGETILQEKQYDHKGRAVRVTKPYIAGAESPVYTVEEYDAFDRKTRVNAPDGSFVTISYDGYESTMTNQYGHAHKRRSDMSERVVESVDRDGNIVVFSYTADGQPKSSSTTFAGASSPSTTITTTYNAQRLKESVTDPNTGSSWTFYDSYGRTIATKDSNDIWNVQKYDNLSRATHRWTGVTTFNPSVFADPPSFETLTETEFDGTSGFGLGKPKQVTFTHKDGGVDRVVVESYSYDLLGRPVETTTTLSGQVAFNGTYINSSSYHLSTTPGYGRVATVTDPGGFVRASVYNSLGFLAEVHDGSVTGNLLWRGIEYDAEGKILMEYNGNGIGTKNRYHPTRGFIQSSQTYRGTPNAIIQDQEMHINALGNVEWRRLTRFEDAVGVSLSTPEVKTESFSFDTQNRLTSSYVPGQTTQSFSFSANGNIQSKTAVGTYTYGDGAGPHAVTGIAQTNNNSRRYTYDAKGRMKNEYLTPGANESEILLREIAYTSFDQPRFVQHWKSAPLSSDLDALGTGMAEWDQVCTIQFYFGVGLQRLIQVKHKGSLVTRVLSLTGYEIRETRRGQNLSDPLVEKEVRSAFGNGSRVLRYTASNPTVPVAAYEFAAEDHLGSDTVTYDGLGQEQAQRGHLKDGESQKTERQSYDAWGARRNGDTWAPSKGQLGESNVVDEREGSNVSRGFTGHEMLDDVGLVHMNGRLYDSALGRMCAADPYVQTPENIQNYNRYSYVLNNPLNAIDPSGHFIVEAIVGIIVTIVGLIASVIITVVAFVAYLAALAAQMVLTVIGLNGAAAAMGSMGSSLLAAAKAGLAAVSAFAGGGAVGGGLLGKVVAGAALGAIYNGAQTAINGGSFSDVLKSAAIGAVTGAVGAVVGGVLAGIPGGVTSALTKGIGQSAAKAAAAVVHSAAHGVAGGLMSMAMGGTFQDGFIGSAIGAGMSYVTGGLSPALESMQGAAGFAARTAVATISGGLGSMLAGGKFSDGAFSAAFFHIFNHESTKVLNKKAVGHVPAFLTVGEGGKSGGMFALAAATYAKNSGNAIIYYVHSGADLLLAMQDFYSLYGPIENWVAFGHGNPEGLYVAQPSAGNAFYREIGFFDRSKGPSSSAVSDIDISWFASGPSVTIYACRCGSESINIADTLSKHLSATVLAHNGPPGTGQSFTGIPGGRPGQGLPKTVPRNYKGNIYLAPSHGEFKFFTP